MVSVSRAKRAWRAVVLAKEGGEIISVFFVSSLRSELRVEDCERFVFAFRELACPAYRETCKNRVRPDIRYELNCQCFFKRNAIDFWPFSKYNPALDEA